GTLKLEVIAAPVRGDDEICFQPCRKWLRQDMDLLICTGPAGGIAHYPTHCIAGRDRDESFARLKRDVADLLRGRIKFIERSLREWVNLHGVHIAVACRFDERVSVRCIDPRGGPGVIGANGFRIWLKL